MSIVRNNTNRHLTCVTGCDSHLEQENNSVRPETFISSTKLSFSWHQAATINKCLSDLTPVSLTHSVSLTHAHTWTFPTFRTNCVCVCARACAPPLDIFGIEPILHSRDLQRTNPHNINIGHRVLPHVSPPTPSSSDPEHIPNLLEGHIGGSTSLVPVW